ncbi:MAG: SufD family Fe-S cluster assembly protein [Thermotogota bacterium]|nr:SufD family Fe-S cluster assembly protein [Thermotogota bacterium]
MERVIDRDHNNMKLIVPGNKGLSVNDYGHLELSSFNKQDGKEYSSFKMKRFFEYEKLRFPDWRKISLEELQLPPLKNAMCSTIKIKGKGIYKPIKEMNKAERFIFESLDFEGSDRKIVLLADIFNSDGNIFKHFDTPLTISTYSGPNRPSYTTNLFVIPENMKVKIHVKNYSEGLVVMNNRFLLQNGSSLDILFSGVTDKNAFSFTNNLYKLENGAELRITDFNISDGTVVPHHFVLGRGEKTKAEIIPAFLVANRGKIDSQYVVKLSGKESHGIINGIGTLDDFAKAIFRPSIHIASEAKGVIGKEQSSMIMLSENSYVQTIPGLFVNENDVEASHAATVDSINEEHLYYLMSRGYNLSEARKMIVVSMFNALFSKIENSFEEECERMKNDIATRID